MLNYLCIKNLALVECLTLEFQGGFTAITGETGAGKSVLLGALTLLAGSRSDKNAIRAQAETCEVEASFYFNDQRCALLNEQLKIMGLPPCEESVLLLYRNFSRSKAPRIQINGALATLSALQDLSEYWVEFHGPGEFQRLFKESYQLELLDGYSNLRTLQAQYREIYRGLCECQQKINALQNGEQLGDEERTFLQMQLQKMADLDLSESGIEQLEKEYKHMSSARERLELASQITEKLTGEKGVATLGGMALRWANQLTDLESDAETLAKRLETALIEVQDLSDAYARYVDATSEAEQEEAVKEKMQQWLDIKRQYGPTFTHVLQKKKAFQERLQSQEGLAERLQILEAEALVLEKKANELAQTMTQSRLDHAEYLSKEVERQLAKLGFQRTHFKVEVQPEASLSIHGNSRAIFLFAPNVGQDWQPLNRIASSGELARVLLALKSVLASVDQVPLLVFDEVDANIGGEIGAVVGRELRKLSQKHQVVCVTHLPQVAALGHQHFVVTKTQKPDHTQVTIERLDNRPQERITELARMLGDRTAQSAQVHAQQLLAEAD